MNTPKCSYKYTEYFDNYVGDREMGDCIRFLQKPKLFSYILEVFFFNTNFHVFSFVLCGLLPSYLFRNLFLPSLFSIYLRVMEHLLNTDLYLLVL